MRTKLEALVKIQDDFQDTVMAKTSKKKKRRGGGKIFGDVTTTLISILVGAIVESVTERLIQQLSSHNIDNDEHSDRHHNNEVPQERHHTHHNPIIKNSLSELRDRVGNVKLTRKDLLEAVSSFAKDPTFNLNDVVALLKDVTTRAVTSSINTVGNEAGVAFEGATDTLKNVTNTLVLNDTDTFDKKDKKKTKKKKKKKS